MEQHLIYVTVAKGIQIGVPATLTPTEIKERVSNYKMSLERSRDSTYNPQTKGFTPAKI